MRGTPRDSLYTLDTLDTLLNLDGGVRPEMVATDNASYSDMAFGLYKMLGFRFAPRFRDLADQRFWRADLPNKDEDVARLSPLKDRHINFLGRYLFTIKAGGPGQGLRPFRDPDAMEDDEDGT